MIKVFCFPLVIFFCFFQFCNGAEPYSVRYQLHKTQAFPRITEIYNGKSSTVESFRLAYNKTKDTPTYASENTTLFVNRFKTIERTLSSMEYNTDPLRDLFCYYLSDFFLRDFVNIYNEFIYQNITTSGPYSIPFGEIFYISISAWHIDEVWVPITGMSANSSQKVEGQCDAFTGWIAMVGAFNSASKAAFEARYNPILCSITRNTMAEWYKLLKEFVLPYRYILYHFIVNQGTMWGVQVDYFIRVAKAYRPAVYESYFIPSPTTKIYPVIDGLNNASINSNFTSQERVYIKNLQFYFTQEFPNYSTPAERMNIFSMKFTESIDSNNDLYKTLSRIQFNNNDCNLLDIIMWTCEKDIYEQRYLAAGGI